MRKYSFQSVGELNAVLSAYNIMAEEVKKEHNGKQYNGIVYSVTNSEGRKLTVPIDAANLVANMDIMLSIIILHVQRKNLRRYSRI